MRKTLLALFVLVSSGLFRGCSDRGVYFKERIKFSVSGITDNSAAKSNNPLSSMNAVAEGNMFAFECQDGDQPCEGFQIEAVKRPPKQPGCICKEFNIIYKGNKVFEVTSTTDNVTILFKAKQITPSLENKLLGKQLSLRQ
ncbi:MAG: hypothetical protein WKF97_13080 [Chitinophagaceae bacterium]